MLKTLKERLKVLDKMTGQPHREDEDDEIPIDEVDLSSEVSAATFKTFVSGVSDCTNMTFNRVKKHWEQNATKLGFSTTPKNPFYTQKLALNKAQRNCSSFGGNYRNHSRQKV